MCDYSFSFWWEKPFLPNPASNSFPRLDTHPSRKVRNAVHKKIAELTTWSLKVAAEGVWPHKGFRDEEFAQRTSRYKKRGKVIANGFKILAETKVFPISMFSSQYFSYSRCPCILQLEPSSGYVFSLSKRIWKLVNKCISSKDGTSATSFVALKNRIENVNHFVSMTFERFRQSGWFRPHLMGSVLGDGDKPLITNYAMVSKLLLS